MCSVRRLRSIGELKVSMHGPMKFVNSVLSPEGQAAQQELAPISPLSRPYLALSRPYLQQELAAKRGAMHANKGPGLKATNAANAAGGTPATETVKKGDASVQAPPLPSSPATAAAAA